MKVVTRYAPSPTGPQHIGGLRTALYCYLFAKQHGGELILRIEDTDQNRFVPGAEEFIIAATKWAGIEFTQGVHIGGPHGPYRQSERMPIYKKYAEELVAKGEAYYAFDTSEEIEEMKANLEKSGTKSPQYDYITRTSMKNSLTLSAEEVKRRLDAGEAHVIRLKVPRNEEIRFHDEIRDWVSIHSSHVDDKVLMKGDGMPTYHLANVVDDHLMEVTHVIRGEEWLSSAPLHVLLYRAFGWENTMPKFAHLPLLLNPDGSKMSKRNSDKFGIFTLPQNWKDPETGDLIQGYREAGYLPEAFLNFLALLGWNPGNDLEIMSMDEMIGLFSLERVHKSGAKFDMDKLKHFNEVYIRNKSEDELLELVKPEMEKAGLIVPDDAFLKNMIHLMKERVTFIRDFATTTGFFFSDPAAYDPEMVKKHWNAEVPELLSGLVSAWKGVDDWSVVNAEASFKDFMGTRGLKPGKLMAGLRVALTGVSFGPGVFEIAGLIGKESSLRRIERAVSEIVPV